LVLGAIAGLTAIGGIQAIAQNIDGLDLEAVRKRAAAMQEDAQTFADHVKGRGDAFREEALAVQQQGTDSLTDLAKADLPTNGDGPFDFDEIIQGASQNVAGTKGDAPQFIVFASLSMPPKALRQLIADTSKAGGIIVFRGFPNNSLKAFTSGLAKVVTVFSGTRETCHKPVFGLVNCCAGKTSGLLTAGAGAAAIAGGPTAIAALATPFLTMFLCSTEEKMLDIKDRMGFCHKVGTYCSSSVLGICKTKRTAYCCFESKLSRILQEQGRPQLNKPWGKPKKEQCEGFTIDEFSRLDLSVMDFTEVYSEFVDAAKLPDEVSTLSEIQDKIQDYYDIHTSQ
jgi:hypothetical protein